jgi:hypothetical protein
VCHDAHINPQATENTVNLLTKPGVLAYVDSLLKARGVKRAFPVRMGYTASQVRGVTTKRAIDGVTIDMKLMLSKTDATLNKWLVLHEVSHALAPAVISYSLNGRRRNEAHGDAFYKVFWTVVKQEATAKEIEVILDRETTYKSRNATTWAKRLGVPGAFAQARKVRERKSAQRISSRPVIATYKPGGLPSQRVLTAMNSLGYIWNTTKKEWEQS